MTETWIDTRNGELLIGREAAADRIDEAGPDVMPLVELLEAREFPFKNDEFGEASSRPAAWTRQDFINFGKWTVNILASAEGTKEGETKLMKRHIERLHILRLCPSYGVFAKLDLKQYRQEIGAIAGKSHKDFDSWSIADFVAYARKIEEANKRRPTVVDYQNADGPGLAVIRARIGINELNELLGYPNVSAMDEDDCINWGVEVMEANNGDLSVPHIEILSKRKRGPSDGTIINKFLRFSVFKERTLQKRELLRARKVTVQEERCKEYQRILSKKGLPEEALKLSKDEIVLFIAKYWVAAKCLPKNPHTTHARLALSKEPLIKATRKVSAYITAEEIETTARQLHVFDDIWPMSKYSHLHVTDEELEHLRKLDLEYKHQRRSSKKA